MKFELLDQNVDTAEGNGSRGMFLSHLNNYLASSGVTQPERQIYVEAKPGPRLAELIFLIILSTLSRLIYSNNTGNLEHAFVKLESGIIKFIEYFDSNQIIIYNIMTYRGIGCQTFCGYVRWIPIFPWRVLFVEAISHEHHAHGHRISNSVYSIICQRTSKVKY